MSSQAPAGSNQSPAISSQPVDQTPAISSHPLTQAPVISSQSVNQTPAISSQPVDQTPASSTKPTQNAPPVVNQPLASTSQNTSGPHITDMFDQSELALILDSLLKPPSVKPIQPRPMVSQHISEAQKRLANVLDKNAKHKLPAIVSVKLLMLSFVLVM